VPEVGLKSRRHAVQRNRGAPFGRGHDQQVGQAQCGQIGSPSVSGQRITQNIVQASASSIRSTCFRLMVRAAAVRRKCCGRGDLRSDGPRESTEAGSSRNQNVPNMFLCADAHTHLRHPTWRYALIHLEHFPIMLHNRSF
jgi:hypothetical protein